VGEQGGNELLYPEPAITGFDGSRVVLNLNEDDMKSNNRLFGMINLPVDQSLTTT
jgi:hypothetical protein